MAFRPYIELRFSSLANPSADAQAPTSIGRNGSIKTIGVEIWTNPPTNFVMVSPITSRGDVSKSACLGLPFDKKALLELAATFAELAESAPDVT